MLNELNECKQCEISVSACFWENPKNSFQLQSCERGKVITVMALEIINSHLKLYYQLITARKSKLPNEILE